MSHTYTDNQKQIVFRASTTGIVTDVRDILEIDPVDDTKIRVKAPYTILTTDVSTPSDIFTTSLDVPITAGIVHDIPPGFTFWIGVKNDGGTPLYNYHFTLEEFDLTEFAIIGRAFTDEVVPLQLATVVGTFWWEGWNYGKTLYDFATSRDLSFSITGGNITPTDASLLYTREEGNYWRFMSYNDLKNPNKGTDPQTAITAYFTYSSAGAFEQTATFEVGFIDVQLSVISLTRSGSTVTATISEDHNLTTSDVTNISGAIETEYNGDQVVTVTGATTFTYTIVGTPATPATGVIKTGTKTAIGADKWSIYKVFHFASSNFESAQRGKQTYDSLNEAQTRKGEEDTALNADNTNAAFTHVAYVKGDATDINNIEQVVFERADTQLSSSGDTLVGSLAQSGVIDWDGSEILTINGGDNTKFDVTEFRVGSVDRTDGIVRFVRTVPASTLNTLFGIATTPFTYVAYNISSDLIVSSGTPFTRSVIFNIIPLGRMWHRNNTIADIAQSLPLVNETSHDYAGQVLAFSALRQDSIVMTPNGANNSVDMAAFVLEVLGGTSTDRNLVDIAQPAGGTAFSFTPVHRAVTTAKVVFDTVVSVIDFTVFDDGSGTLAVLSTNNRFGIHYFYIVPFRDSFDVFLIRGDQEYNTIADAQAALIGRTITQFADFNGGMYYGAVIGQKIVTDLTSAVAAGDASIHTSDRFGAFGVGT